MQRKGFYKEVAPAALGGRRQEVGLKFGTGGGGKRRMCGWQDRGDGWHVSSFKKISLSKQLTAAAISGNQPESFLL